MATHRGSTGHRPLTDQEKGEFYRRLGRLRTTLKEAIKPVFVALGGTSYGRPGDPTNAIATVQAVTIAMKVLEAMRTEAVYEAGFRGAGYPDIGAAAGISRQAARLQWPGAVYSKENRRCQLFSYLEKIAPSLPDVDCDDNLVAGYRIEHKAAPAGPRRRITSGIPGVSRARKTDTGNVSPARQKQHPGIRLAAPDILLI